MDHSTPEEYLWKSARFGLGKGVSCAPQQKGRRSNRGFSLVETAIAIGVMAFALVSIMGLVPMGLTTFRKAMDTSVGSQIVQQVLSDIQQSGVAQQAGTQTFRYFDDQGNYLGNSAETSGVPSSALYHVNTAVQYPSQFPHGRFSETLATVTVEIATNPKNSQLQVDPDTSKIVETPDLQVARYSILLSAQN